MISQNTKDAFYFIAFVRRNARQVFKELEHCRFVASRHRRNAKVFKEQNSPFNAARISSELESAEYFQKRIEIIRESIFKLGQILVNAAPTVDAATTLEQRCDILNINRADRGKIKHGSRLIDLIFVDRLEDSAVKRSEYENGPLYELAFSVFSDFLMNHPEGRKLGDSLFEPGGMFEGVPMYKMAADGTMVRQPPRLRVIQTEKG